jgi:hypothetical protein
VKRSRWYVTRYDKRRAYEKPESQETKSYYENEAVWTIGPETSGEQWNTDMAYPGYGMSKADAERAVACYNACLDLDDPEEDVRKMREEKK